MAFCSSERSKFITARGIRTNDLKTPFAAMISLRGVSLVYPNGVRAIDGIDLEIGKGDFVFLVGHSGTGKSSLLRLLYREMFPTSGEITVDGIRVDRLRANRVPMLRR